MTRQEAREAIQNLRPEIGAMHAIGNFERRNRLCKLHDTLMLAMLVGDGIPDLPRHSRQGSILKVAA